MNNNMLPILALFGLMLWLIISEGQISEVKPKLIKSTTSKREYL